MAKKKKFRAEFRKNRGSRARPPDLTREFRAGDERGQDRARQERVSGKGELTRKRVVIGEEAADADGFAVTPDVDLAVCRRGRVLAVYGLTSEVESEDGAVYQCATRRLLKTLSTGQRHVVAAGDWVYFRPAGGNEGIIERIEPRHGVISRTSRGRQHVIASNVDQMIIVTSAAEPYIKPNLIDRFLLTAEQNGLRPLICINKVDLIDPAELQPLVGVYSRMGYQAVLLSARDGAGVDFVRRELKDRSSVVVGQSGVGKSSLLNAVEAGLNLRIGAVSSESQKGKHTTTTARLIRLLMGGYVIDTPGIRQFQLWDIIPAEVVTYFRDLRPYVSRCRFPNCTHSHEADCAIKDAVADGHLDARRYESYLALLADEPA
ncbi:MAG: ribosome small subunit-dependent GTPase A [Pirellulales bacterium]